MWYNTKLLHVMMEPLHEIYQYEMKYTNQNLKNIFYMIEITVDIVSLASLVSWTLLYFSNSWSSGVLDIDTSVRNSTIHFSFPLDTKDRNSDEHSNLKPDKA